ncbi:MAG: YkgJ family cysteine cluster protein [Vicingus serpentipes]|nr:YkgJ family cysteine cluster protein [Vicingus serpentipes]
MNKELEQKIQQALAHQKENKQLVKQLKKSKPKNLDATVHQLHEEVFEQINCLECANCCKTTSPAIHDRDVDRLAKHLKLKPSQLIEQHLEMDEEGDYVFRSAPCPFLGEDNYCAVYEARPLACREYPHTNRKRFYQVLNLSLKNTEICPAVASVFEGLREG